MARKDFLLGPKPKRSRLLLSEENLLRDMVSQLEAQVIRGNQALREREAELFKTISNISNQLAATQDECVKLAELRASEKSDYESKLNAMLEALVAMAARAISPREPS
jgi:hypothetical protein